MTETERQINAPHASGSHGSVPDAVVGNWVDNLAPRWSRPYLRLSRADRPIGTWLLLIPCWWGLLLAMGHTGQARWSDVWIAVGCAIGAFLMRGAGCTWNDLTDREIDAQVERTRWRPIPSGQVTPRQALVWAIIQSLLAFLILITFNWAAVALGVASLGLVAIYPFAKRFTWWPQVFLGLAINWGALLAWTAHTGSLHPAPLALYAAGIAWTLFYDTIYACQDKEDDALIGVKSTARLFEGNTHRWLRYFLMMSLSLFLLAVVLSAPGNILTLTISLCGIWAMGWHLLWQLRSLDPDDGALCMRLFRSNRNAGLIPTLFLLLALLA